jgi:predicted nucleotidyltransferase
MTGIFEQLKTVASCMEQIQIPWALIGGLAVSIHGAPRTTRDIDLAVFLETETEQDNLVKDLTQAGFFDKQLIMHLSPVRKLGVRLRVPAVSSSVPVDLLYSSSGIEKEVIASAQLVEMFPNIFIPVATLAHLLAMKIVSENEIDRMQDTLDIQGLIKEATQKDLEHAKTAMRLIQQRGFSRGKDLLLRFEELHLRFGVSR